MHNPLHNADGLAMDVFQVATFIIGLKIIINLMMNNIIIMMIRMLNMMNIKIIQEHEGTHILQSLDGFAISLASDGRYIDVMP